MTVKCTSSSMNYFYLCRIRQGVKVFPPLFLFLCVFISTFVHRITSVDLVRVCTCMHCEKILSLQYLRFGVISVLLQAEEKLICFFLACCCFTKVFNHLSFYQDEYRVPLTGNLPPLVLRETRSVLRETRITEPWGVGYITREKPVYIGTHTCSLLFNLICKLLCTFC